ncbi:MAG: hypothetical protein P0Y66_22410 [Candidatus Kaistia colombiensis]|nr:MAG: hypothetical protein P0Y66_22410 [Kaistia sp.]
MTAFKIERPDTAFANAPASGPKRKRVTDEAHLRWIRTLPCVISGKRPVDAAHIRFADPSYGKRETGKAEKSSDRWALPLFPALHREQHDGNERLFWAKYGIDPCRVAAALYGVSGDDEQAEIIIRTAQETARQMVSTPYASERLTPRSQGLEVGRG